MKYLFEKIATKAEDVFATDCNMWELDQPIPEVRKRIRDLEQLLIETRELISGSEVDTDTEIYCFKVVKPQILGRILFLKDVIYLKSEEMYGMIEFNKATLNRRTKEIAEFIEKNRRLLRYSRSEDTQLDSHYFTRDYHRENLKCDAYYCHCLPEFSTDVDMEWAQLICYEFLGRFIAYRHQMLDIEADTQIDTVRVGENMTWTKNGTDIVELACALHAVGAFNHGGADLIEIVRLLEYSFNTKVGDCYKIYTYCRGRKKERIAFLKLLAKTLTDKMDLDDKE